MMIYGETFYGRHTAQHQLQQSKIKVKKDCLQKQKKHKFTKSRIGLCIDKREHF